MTNVQTTDQSRSRHAQCASVQIGASQWRPGQDQAAGRAAFLACNAAIRTAVSSFDSKRAARVPEARSGR